MTIKGLHNLTKTNKISKKRRLGRGDTTAGKGTKGQKSRSGKGSKHIFGEDRFYLKMPILRGFTNTANKRKVHYHTVRLNDLSKIPEGVEVSTTTMVHYNVIKSGKRPSIVATGDYDGKQRNFSSFDGRISKKAQETLKSKGVNFA